MGSFCSLDEGIKRAAAGLLYVLMENSHNIFEHKASWMLEQLLSNTAKT